MKATIFGAVDYVTYNTIAQGKTVKVIFPESGTVVAPRPMIILKSSQHVDSTKRKNSLITCSLTRGSNKVAKAWLMPARTDIKAQCPLITEIWLLPTQQEGNANRALILKNFATLFG